MMTWYIGGHTGGLKMKTLIPLKFTPSVILWNCSFLVSDGEIDEMIDNVPSFHLNLYLSIQFQEICIKNVKETVTHALQYTTCYKCSAPTRNANSPPYTN